jgi:hypothetical protein
LIAATLIVDVPVALTLTSTVEGVEEMVKSWTAKVTLAEWDRLALVPVTTTWNVPVEVKVQDSMEVPGLVTLVGETVQDVLLVTRLATPLKPLMEDTVIVEVAAAFTSTLILVGLADIVKSWTTSVTVTGWERLLLVPVTDTCLLPVDVNVQDSVEVPDPVTLVGETVQDEVVFVARLTTPAKPFTALTVIVRVPAAFTLTGTLVGLALMVKSWTTKVTVTGWDRLLLVPVTLTWKVPVDVNVHVSVEVPEPVTPVGDMVHDVLFVARLTIPANPFTADTVIVEVPAALTFTLTLVGLALIV